MGIITCCEITKRKIFPFYCNKKSILYKLFPFIRCNIPYKHTHYRCVDCGSVWEEKE